jgi:hypothetical protein
VRFSKNLKNFIVVHVVVDVGSCSSCKWWIIFFFTKEKKVRNRLRDKIQKYKSVDY